MEVIDLSPDIGAKALQHEQKLVLLQHDQLLAYARDLRKTFRQLRQTHDKLEELYISTLSALAGAIEARDPYLEGHSRSVMRHALSVGQQIGFYPKQLEALRRAALLHDVGKIGIPDAVLKKQGPLDQTEWNQMREHPEVGFRILSGLEYLGEALPGIRHHHERYDGQGYPSGLAGSDIPLIARILSVCDSFDAMTSDRTYRPAMSKERAVCELLEGGGTQFDPQVVDFFIRALRDDP